MQTSTVNRSPQQALIFADNPSEDAGVTNAMPIPGTACEIRYTRNSTGCLLAIEAAGRPYLRYERGWRTFGNGIAAFAQNISPGGMVRLVRTPHASWSEKYQWDRNGRAAEVDGTAMRYDERGRIIECRGEVATWCYEYSGHDLTAIVAPTGRRKIHLDAEHRPIAVAAQGRVTPISYDKTSRRNETAVLPANWHRDELGRLWTITDESGAVLHTFIWDGFFCLGRIDGAPGEPLAVVFSLDLTGTPVRIISRLSVERIMRDGFGETLLDRPLTPGLYGGTVYGGSVHFRSRQLDPYIGYFNAPDPFDGGERDPRRNSGFTGPLRVERPAGGAWCVCNHNPVSRADFCGEASEGWTVLMTLSDLTWSLQNNVVSWFGFDGTLNLWASLFGGIGNGELTSRFGFSEWFRSERTGAWGVFRSGAFGLERAFTLQHTIMCQPDDLNENADIRVFAPAAVFQPTFYGSVLRIEPEGRQPLLLRGSSHCGATQDAHLPMSWTRSGGPAHPVIPGSTRPCFPEGGLHFDSVDGVRGPCDGACTELTTGTIITTGTLGQHPVVVLGVEDAALAVDVMVLIYDASGAYAISRILQSERRDGHTRLVLDVLAGAAPASSVSLRQLMRSGVEDLSIGTQPTHIEATAAAQTYYAETNPVRLTQGSVIFDTAIARLEAAVTIDDALPAGLTGPISIFTAQPVGIEYRGQVGATAGVIACIKADGTPADRIPAVGECIMVRAGADWLACGVNAAPAATDRTLDRDISALGAAATEVFYRFLESADALGSAETAPAGTDLTYESRIVTAAPASGYLKMRDSSTPAKSTAREVDARLYDGIILAAAPGGSAATPYQVECFSRIEPADPTAYNSAQFTNDFTLVVDTPAALDGAVAMRLHQMGGPAIAAALPGIATIADREILQKPSAGPWFFACQYPWNGGIEQLKPNQIVYVGNGGDPSVALIGEIRALLKLQRQVTVAQSGVAVVGLQPEDPVYHGERKDTTHLTILPIAQTSVPGGERVQMPQFGVNAIVWVTYTSTDALGAVSNESRLYRIVSVMPNSCTVEVVDDDPMEGVTITDLRVQRMTPADPGTGWSRAGIDGVPTGSPDTNGMVPTQEINFRVYSLQPLGAFSGTRVALVWGDLVVAARIDATNATLIDYEVFFPAQPPLTGLHIDVTLPDPAKITTGYAPAIEREENGFRIPTDPALTPLTAGLNPIVVVPLVATGVTSSGTVTSGTTKVPTDPETWEFDRKRSLVEHELTHTKQYQQWGPLMFSFFPTGVFQDVLELTTGVDEPNLSPYVAAVLGESDGRRTITIANPAGIDFAEDDTVELSQNGRSRRIDLGPVVTSNVFLFEGTLAPLQFGDLYIRKVRSTGMDVGEGFINVLQMLTHGGLCNIVVGGVWGGLFHLISRGIYALAHLSDSSSGRYYDVTFENSGTTLRFVNAADAAALRSATRVIVKKDEATVVREVSAIAGNDITLVASVNFTGTGGVSPYSSHDPASAWDWYTYYPANVSDPDRPARITLSASDAATLGLARLDRVKVIAGTTTETTTVMAVDGANVELRNAPVLPSGETSLRVAKVSSSDPTGGWDDWFIEYFDMDWMKWLLDPWGRIDYNFRPGSGWQALTRGLRYAFGTQSWSLLPAFGWLWWDNLFHGADGGHMSRMEQEASEESGDLYSAFAKLRQSVEYVGDIGRYWYFAWDFSRRSGHVLDEDQLDTPGVHYRDAYRPRLLPAHTSGFTPSADPNGDREAPAGSGSCLPDLFAQRNWSSPWNPPGTITNPPAFMPADAAIIPFSPQLERCGATYFAFSQPGAHRISVSNHSSAETMEVQEWGRQRIWWDLIVQDVTVRCAALPVAENATITLLRTQRAVVRVSPNTDRRYALTLPDTEGAFVRLDSPTVLEALTSDTADAQPVEVGRLYTRNADGTFDTEVLNHHKTSIFSNIRIPVRQFSIQVIHLLHFRTTIPTAAQLATDIAINSVSEVRPGDTVYVLIPCPDPGALSPGTITYPVSAPSNGYTDPAPVPDTEAVPAELAEYIADGGIVKLTFGSQDPPQENVLIPYTVHVGRVGNDADLSANITLKPHFRLTSSAGYQVIRGSSLTLNCMTEAGDPVAKIGTVQITPADGVTPTVTVDRLSVAIDIAADAPLGIRRVLIEDQDHAGHFSVRTIEVV
jgi:hypothetical protein